MTIKKALHGVGWILLATAFLAASAEVVVRASPDGGRLFVSTRDLWYHLAPGDLIVMELRLEQNVPFLFDPFIKFLMKFPAWVLIGGPGVVVLWKTWPARRYTEEELAELAEREETLFLYDELAREARAQGHDLDGDDMAPSHVLHHRLDQEAFGAADVQLPGLNPDGTLDYHETAEPVSHGDDGLDGIDWSDVDASAEGAEGGTIEDSGGFPPPGKD